MCSASKRFPSDQIARFVMLLTHNAERSYCLANRKVDAGIKTYVVHPKSTWTKVEVTSLTGTLSLRQAQIQYHQQAKSFPPRCGFKLQKDHHQVSSQIAFPSNQKAVPTMLCFNAGWLYHVGQETIHAQDEPLWRHVNEFAKETDCYNRNNFAL